MRYGLEPDPGNSGLRLLGLIRKAFFEPISMVRCMIAPRNFADMTFANRALGIKLCVSPVWSKLVLALPIKVDFLSQLADSASTKNVLLSSAEKHSRKVQTVRC